jgi:organic hydroperoxide reductase OsmC/OhrA
MSEHKAVVKWTFAGEDFKKGRYSREHTWTFDGGATVAASSSPSVVPVPLSNPANVDPEEAFVASLSSCHLLTFLHLAYRQGFEVTSYEDEAVGLMTKNEQGVPWISQVTLAPRVVYRVSPSSEQEAKLHDAAHHGCFIANSVKTAITVSPRRA